MNPHLLNLKPNFYCSIVTLLIQREQRIIEFEESNQDDVFHIIFSFILCLHSTCLLSAYLMLGTGDIAMSKKDHAS